MDLGGQIEQVNKFLLLSGEIIQEEMRKLQADLLKKIFLKNMSIIKKYKDEGRNLFIIWDAFPSFPYTFLIGSLALRDKARIPSETSEGNWGFRLASFALNF